MTYAGHDPDKPSWIASWLLLAIVGVVILLVGIGIGALTRRAATVHVSTTVTVTAEAAPAISPGPSGDQFSDGTYQVGVEIPAGNYHTDGGKNCYWERLNNLAGGFTAIIANGEPTEPTTVRVLASDKAFGVKGGCSWQLVP